ncbi:hypothetical protein K2X33_07975, partial [bacterium]|nr:hypothetical protein [bacterium]
MKPFVWGLAISLLSARAVSASSYGVFEEDFSSYHGSVSDSAVWNTERGALHVPAVVNRAGAGSPGQEDEAVSLGTGADGVFDADTAASWDINGGAVANEVVLDTSRTYEFTHFTLPAGITLKGSGSDALKIHVLGDVSIAGDIDLRG